MTKRQPPRPNGLNRIGTGKGLKKLSHPPTKKRGVNLDRTEPVKQARRGLDTSSYAGAEQVSPDKALTEKQRLFVMHWARGESVLSASARAGYGDAGTYAYRMIRMPNILKLYNEEKRLYEEASQMTRKKVMDGLLDGINMAKLVSEPASVITGWKTIGQMCGYFEPVKRRLDINVTGSIEMNRLNRMSDAELLRVIQEGAAAELELLENTPTPGEEEE